MRIVIHIVLWLVHRSRSFINYWHLSLDDLLHYYRSYLSDMDHRHLDEGNGPEKVRESLWDALNWHIDMSITEDGVVLAERVVMHRKLDNFIRWAVYYQC